MTISRTVPPGVTSEFFSQLTPEDVNRLVSSVSGSNALRYLEELYQARFVYLLNPHNNLEFIGIEFDNRDDQVRFLMERM